jgi:hypothetical protein
MLFDLKFQVFQRSAAARHSFARRTGYQNGRPGYLKTPVQERFAFGAVV